MSCEIRIGCSGWSYKHWLGRFYPEKLPAARMMEEYCKYFDTVEINSSFYHLPRASTFEGWKTKTPPRFAFSVKASRFITHLKRLNDVREPVDLFYSRAVELKRKFGVVLFQLPPGLKADYDKLEAFLRLLPKNKRATIEFRNASWHTEETYELLRKFNVAFCAWDLGGVQSPIEVTADFAYVRLHGPSKQKYWGSYSDEALHGWAKRITTWSRKLKAVYVFFDNDPEAFAPYDALRLKELLKLPVIRPDPESLRSNTLFD